MTTLGPALRKVATTATANATLTKGKLTPVDATSGARTMTLPTGAAEGVTISVQKVDSTSNTVTISGSIRGSASTVVLYSQYESRDFVADSSGSWWPIADHRTKTSLDNQIAAPTGALVQHRYTAAGDEPGACISWTADDGYGSFVPYFNLLHTKGVKGTLFGTQNWINDVQANPRAVTLTAAGDTVNLTAHGIGSGAVVALRSLTGGAGLTADTVYYVVNPTTNTFQLSATSGGSAIDITSDGTATLVNANASWKDIYITAAQVAALVADGHELGEHGYNHEDKPSLVTSLGAAGTQAFTDGVVNWLSTTFSTPVRTSAYPAGLSDRRSREIQARSVTYARGTKGAVAYNANDPFDVPAIDVLLLTEAQIKAYIDQAVAENSLVVFLTHGIQASSLSAFLTKIGNCVDYAASLGVPQKTFYEAMSERTVQRGPAGSSVDSLGNAFFRNVKATRLVVSRDDTLASRAWFDIDETTNMPYFDADGGQAWKFLKPVRMDATFSVGQRLILVDGSLTSGSPTVGSNTAGFDAADVGRTISGTGIPGGTTITAVAANGLSATMSANATATATNVTITLGRPVAPTTQFNGDVLVYKNFRIRDTNGAPSVSLEDGAGTVKGGVSLTSWFRSGSGGAMLIDSGTGGSTITAKGFRFQVTSQAGSAKYNICTAAPTDASLSAGEGGTWFISTTGASTINWKVLEAGGTSRTITLPMTPVALAAAATDAATTQTLVNDIRAKLVATGMYS